MIKTKLILVAIIILAFFLRFFQLGKNPSSLYWDEASLGYNAWSILKSGKDEHGDFLPLTNFKAFGDYKPPVYIYLTAASIGVFGKTDFSVRFPSAFFGVISVLCTYLIVKSLMIYFRIGVDMPARLWRVVPLLSSFFLAISPWAINLSRVAFEANVAWGLFLIGLTLFLNFVGRERLASRRSGSRSFPTILSLFLIPIFFVLPFYTFNSSRIFIPLFLILLLIFFHKEILKNKFQFIASCLLFIAVLVPLVPHLMSKEGQLRFNEVNIFTNPVPITLSNDRIARDNGAVWSKIINNRRVYYFFDYLKHFTDNFKFDYLFLSGDVNNTFSTGRMGQLYVIDSALIIAGIIFLFAKSKKTFLFLLLWLIFGIAPTGVARETPHALRSLNVLPVYQILSAVGFVFFIKMRKILIKIGLFLLTVSVFVWYLNDYYFVYAKSQGKYFQYGYAQVAAYLEKHQKEYKQIYMTGFYGRPYIYILWYEKIPSREFLTNSNIVKNEFGFYNVYKFKNIYFDLPEIPVKNSLLIVEPLKASSYPNMKILKKIYYPSGEMAFVIGKT